MNFDPIRISTTQWRARRELDAPALSNPPFSRPSFFSPKGLLGFKITIRIVDCIERGSTQTYIAASSQNMSAIPRCKAFPASFKLKRQRVTHSLLSVPHAFCRDYLRLSYVSRLCGTPCQRYAYVVVSSYNHHSTTNFTIHMEQEEW